MKTIFFAIFLSIIFTLSDNTVLADWWERPTARPTQPTIRREETPTPQSPQPTATPTSAVIQPSPTPGGTGGVPTQPPSGGGTTSEDGCASGKSYTGPYCGWSPEKDKTSETTGGGGEAPRIGGPEVLGLSYTGGSELTVSDIMLLTGVLCLLLYVRSKTGLTIRPR